MEGIWICENCKSEFKGEDMNYEEICEECKDEDHEYHCEWHEKKKIGGENEI